MSNSNTIKETVVNVGDNVKVHYQFKEGEKTKEQIFQGLVMKFRGMGANKSFTVRKVTKDGTGVERIIPVASPFISKIEVFKKGNVRRAKINFIRRMSEREKRERLS